MFLEDPWFVLKCQFGTFLDLSEVFKKAFQPKPGFDFSPIAISCFDVFIYLFIWTVLGLCCCTGFSLVAVYSL